MSLTSRFLEDQTIMLNTWSGNISDSELIRFYMGIYNNSHWQPGFDEIIDLRDAELSDISKEALTHLSELATNCLKGEPLRLALIAPSDLTSSLAHIYEAFTHVPNESTKVFHHMSEALDWLNT